MANSAHYYHIGIGFAARYTLPVGRSQPAREEIIRGRQQNPEWTLLFEPVTEGKQPFSTSNVQLHRIRFEPDVEAWRLFSERQAKMSDDEDMTYILCIGTYRGLDLDEVYKWIKGMPSGEDGDNPSGFPLNWYSATWVIRVLHKLRAKYPWCTFQNVPTRQLHERILGEYRYTKQKMRVGNRFVRFGMLSP